MNADGPRLVRASSQRKRDALLAKAAVLIAKKGFEATSMRDLSAAMNGSLAGLYHYFRSKEDLLFQLQHRTFSSLLAAQEEVAQRPGTAEERLDRLIGGHLRFYAKHTNELKACTFELESLTGEALEAVEAIRRQYYRLMTSAVAAVMNGAAANGKASRKSRHAALFIFGMLNWVFTWYDPARHGTMESVGREMRDLVMDGLRRTK